MSVDFDIQKAIEAGTRNQEVKELIHNWCRHARVEKFGGTGLVEMQTGLPIGHLFMACDFASAHGMATWQLEDAALHFYDANCVGCSNRQPVGLPNISSLVTKREEKERLTHERAEEIAREKEAALRRRSEIRTKLREKLTVPATTFVDDLHEFDVDRGQSKGRNLIESIRLAPEILVPDLEDHLFSLLESREHWFADVGLAILSESAVDQKRLVRCAMRCLTAGNAIELAATIVASKVLLVEANDVPEAIIGLALVASPPHSDFAPTKRRKPNPVPLERIANSFPTETKQGIDVLLRSRSPFRAGLAARAIELLISTDSTRSNQYARDLAAELSRADILVDLNNGSELRNLEDDLRGALVGIFLNFPKLIDAELMRQFESASLDGEGRLTRVYEDLVQIRAERRNPDFQISDFEPYRVAYRRLVNLAETSENPEVTQHVQSALAHSSPLVGPIAKELMDLFLGAAAVIDSKIQAPPSDSQLIVPPDLVTAMEQENRRTTLWHIRESFIGLAIQGAQVDSAGLDAFEAFLSRRKVLGDSLEAAVIRKISPLLETGAGLRTLLPYLYGAMVGPSTQVRAAAAKALEEIGSLRFAELPELVPEAFLMMLYDPYVMVHKAAVSALRRITLPNQYDQLVAAALDNLIIAYRDNKKNQEFLVECIEARVSGKRNDAQFMASHGEIFVALLGNVRPQLLLRSGHHYFIKSLCNAKGYAQLVLGLIPCCQTDYDVEHVLDMVREIPRKSSGEYLKGISDAVDSDPLDVDICGTFVELLSRDGEWEAAAQIAQKRVAAISNTPRDRVRKLNAQQLQWRAEFEYKVSQKLLEEAISLGKAWQSAEKEITEIQELNEKSNPFRSLFRANPNN